MNTSHSFLCRAPRLILGAVTLLMAFGLQSCGIFEYEPAEEETKATAMHFDQDTIHVMIDCDFTINPIFTPVDIGHRSMFWQIENPDIVTETDPGLFTAKEEGWTTVYGTAIVDHLTDSCTVDVLPRWDDYEGNFPYEMLVNAKVLIHGQPLEDPWQYMLVAFVGDQQRAVGWAVDNVHVGTYFHIRIGSDIPHSDDPDLPDYLVEHVTFKLLGLNSHDLYEFPQEIIFDSESHGTLSNLYELSIP